MNNEININASEVANETKKEFKPKSIGNPRIVKEKVSDIGTLTEKAKRLMNEFTNFFGYFDINDLREFIDATDSVTWIKEKWVKVKKVKTNGWKLEALFKNDLIEIPEFGMLVYWRHEYKSMLQSKNLDLFINIIDDLFDYKENKMVNPIMRDDGELLEKIEKQYSVFTKNDQENEYLELLEQIAEGYYKLINSYKFPANIAPSNFFTLTNNSGIISVNPHIKVIGMMNTRLAHS